MNVYWKVIALLSLLALPSYAKEYAEITAFTRSIHERLYIVTRLEKPVNLIISNQNKISSFYSDKLQRCTALMNHIKHPLIHQCIVSMQNFNEMRNFAKLWNEVRAYKYLEDKLLIHEFVQLTCYLVRTTLLENMPLDRSNFEKPESNEFQYSLDQELELLALYIEQFEFHENKGEFCINAFQTLRELLRANTEDFSISHNSDKIFKRFYHIKRLTKPISLLIDSQNSWSFSIFERRNPHAVFDTKFNYTHEHIKNSIYQMEKKKNIQPFLHLWQGFQTFRHIDDSQFLKEILVLLFTAYKNMLANELSTRPRRQAESALARIQDLYDNIQFLPTEQMLTAIDELTKELELLMKSTRKSKLRKFTHTFAKTYRYALPIIAGIIATYCIDSCITSSPT